MIQLAPLFTERGTDKVYEALRRERNSTCRNARSFIERLWAKVGYYLDSDFPSDLRQHFQQRFWELYVAAVIQDAGLCLEKKDSAKGPDILLRMADQRIWIEAIAVDPGKGADAVTEPKVGKVYAILDDQIKLRITSAFEEKFKKYKRYVDDSIVSSSDPYIVAINTGKVPGATKERELPRIVRTLLPFGHEVLHLDGESFKVVESSHEYQGEIRKRSGAGIPTTAFLDSQYSGISAIFYSTADALNHPDFLGSDFIVVLNPFAKNPLSRDFFQRGCVYWVECLKDQHWPSLGMAVHRQNPVRT